MPERTMSTTRPVAAQRTTAGETDSHVFPQYAFPAADRVKVTDHEPSSPLSEGGDISSSESLQHKGVTAANPTRTPDNISDTPTMPLTYAAQRLCAALVFVLPAIPVSYLAT